ncbi:MAG TPA: hypothetical protein VNZ64_17365 [Candidatus Acidoferrum sp.]|jgi:hypothetical protein|nr:hypothetical protein [Candidatus Acidoferrum sp.]
MARKLRIQYPGAIYHEKIRIRRYPLAKFAAAALTNSAALNYDIGWLVGGQWMNYTRTYPAGNYFVYGRFAGGAAFQSQLDQITATVTNRLGMFSSQGRGWTSYDWTQLVDTNGQRSTISLGGVSTLRFTSLGGANANFFMLAPAIAAPTPVRITATASGANVTMSFPTLSGYNYKVYYRSDLGSATWNLLTMVAGDGSVKSVSDSAAAGNRFYRLEIQ